jgi:hypothetical protein
MLVVTCQGRAIKLVSMIRPSLVSTSPGFARRLLSISACCSRLSPNG